MQQQQQRRRQQQQLRWWLQQLNRSCLFPASVLLFPLPLLGSSLHSATELTIIFMPPALVEARKLYKLKVLHKAETQFTVPARKIGHGDFQLSFLSISWMKEREWMDDPLSHSVCLRFFSPPLSLTGRRICNVHSLEDPAFRCSRVVSYAC